MGILIKERREVTFYSIERARPQAIEALMVLACSLFEVCVIWWHTYVRPEQEKRVENDSQGGRGGRAA